MQISTLQIELVLEAAPFLIKAVNIPTLAYLSGLVLHGDHTNKHLVTLDAESTIYIMDGVGLGIREQRVHAALVM